MFHCNRFRSRAGLKTAVAKPFPLLPASYNPSAREDDLHQPGTLLEGKYEILGKIREGGMGTIYQVRHRLLDEIRVVKVMQPHVVGDAEMKRPLPAKKPRPPPGSSTRTSASIYDFALDDDGTAYLVMEYIDGVNLADLLKSQGPPGHSHRPSRSRTRLCSPSATCTARASSTATSRPTT